MLPNMHWSHQHGLTTRSTGFLADRGLWVVLFTLVLASEVCRPATAQDAQPKPEAPARMSADADPAYEVVTVKPSNPDNNKNGFNINGSRFEIENETIETLLMFAHGVHPKQIVDGPAWFTSAHYDIDGVIDVHGQPSLKQLQRIVQKLLADRFQLKFHRETREQSVYAITVAKGGSKLGKSTGDPDALGNVGNDMHAGQNTMTINNFSMAEFALVMQLFTDRPVVDQTGLAGKWDFKWTWTVDESRVPPDSNAAPGLFTAIQEQLGLKLKPVKAPADAFVIDHVERPSAN